MGYTNVQTIINGRPARQVVIDEARADHVRWAFETYASAPDMALTKLTDFLADRGLTIRATAKQPERPLKRSHVHRMLTNRYYLGYTSFRGVEYPGVHEPLIDEDTFQRVQRAGWQRTAAPGTVNASTCTTSPGRCTAAAASPVWSTA